MLQDSTFRRYHVAVCTKVEPLTAADVSRRDFEQLRTGFGRSQFSSLQAYMAFQQAFTRKAVEARYDLQRPAGEMRDEAAGKTADQKPADAPK